MKVIIAGSRTITAYAIIEAAIVASGIAERIAEVVSGAAEGVDSLGEKWATEHGIPVRRFPANWKKFGKSAGPRRNSEMADYADVLIAVWDGVSSGTLNMMRQMDARHKPTFGCRTDDGVACWDEHGHKKRIVPIAGGG